MASEIQLNVKGQPSTGIAGLFTSAESGSTQSDFEALLQSLSVELNEEMPNLNELPEELSVENLKSLKQLLPIIQEGIDNKNISVDIKDETKNALLEKLTQLLSNEEDPLFSKPAPERLSLLRQNTFMTQIESGADEDESGEDHEEIPSLTQVISPEYLMKDLKETSDQLLKKQNSEVHFAKAQMFSSQFMKNPVLKPESVKAAEELSQKEYHSDSISDSEPGEILSGAFLNQLKPLRARFTQENSIPMIQGKEGYLTQALVQQSTQNSSGKDLNFNSILQNEINLKEHINNSAEFGSEMGEKLLWMTTKQLQSASIRLNPAELGPIEVRIQMKDDGVNILFNSHHASVRDVLEQSIPRLREMFNENNLNLNNVNVNDFKEGNRQAFNQQSSQNNQNNSHSNTASNNDLLEQNSDVLTQGELSLGRRGSDPRIFDAFV